MNRIQPLAPEKCPSCGAGNSFRVVEGAARCARCGSLAPAAQSRTSQSSAGGGAHVSNEELQALFGDAEPSASIREAIDVELQRRRESYRPSYILRHKNKDEIDPYTEAIFSTAMDHVTRKDWDGAIHHLRRAVENNHELTDPHMWLARLLPDEADRRQHYKAVLAQDMQNGDALRELMILDGELDPDSVASDFSMPEVRAAGEVTAQSRGVKCPRCGAPKLNTNPAWPGLLKCGACGHEIAAPVGGGDRNVARALIKKRSQAVEWVVGTRVLRCNGCGAQRTFAADQLAELCPFCGSRNVITQDATGNLMQPDSVVPFAMDEAQVLETVREALMSGMERLKSWFVDNRAQRLFAEAVYLPFWAFDAAVDVTRTTRVRDDTSRTLAPFSSPPMAHQTEQFADAMYNVLVPGVAQPPDWLLARLGKFDAGYALAYKPELIAQHGAEIYTKDFDRASLDARTLVNQSIRDKYTVSTSTETTVSVFSIIRPISFRLLLVPVWAITIHERDGDVRPALVNGQSGKVAFGKATRPA